MGKSDPFVQQKYVNVMTASGWEPNKTVCFLGYPGPNPFTAVLEPGADSVFLDLENGWNINDVHWDLTDASFDAVVCTRVAYFCKDVATFFDEVYRVLKPGGFFLIDWGLGDHWRFTDYKVGWMKDGEHEHAYEDDNFLWSSAWNDCLESQEEYLRFAQCIVPFGYNDAKKAIFDEVPAVFDTSQLDDRFDVQHDTLFLWPNAPQLYIILSGRKK